jgi:hypothetical protein
MKYANILEYFPMALLQKSAILLFTVSTLPPYDGGSGQKIRFAERVHNE